MIQQLSKESNFGRFFNATGGAFSSAWFSRRLASPRVPMIVATARRKFTFAEFRVAPPEGNSVEVCHAYTCQMKTTFYFRPKDIQVHRCGDVQDEEGRHAPSKSAAPSPMPSP